MTARCLDQVGRSRHVDLAVPCDLIVRLAGTRLGRQMNDQMRLGLRNCIVDAASIANVDWQKVHFAFPRGRIGPFAVHLRMQIIEDPYVIALGKPVNES